MFEPGEYANFWRAFSDGPNIADMGRAAGQPRAVGADCRRREPPHPVAWVEHRTRPHLGIEVVDHGYLDEPYGGHQVGAPYVVISAACGMDRETARRLLEPLSGLPDLAWDCGWTGRRQPNGQQVTELQLFPQSSGGITP